MTTAERLRTFWGERQLGSVRVTSVAVRYWEIAAFASIMLVAFVMRLWGVDERAVHHDESLHIFYGWQLFDSWDFNGGRGYTHVPFMHGPLQFFGNAVSFFLWPFHDNEFSARLMYTIVGSALVGTPFFLRNYLGRGGALIAALLIAFSPTLLYFSRFSRGDIYMALATAGLVICLWRYLKEQKPNYLFGVAFFLMMGFISKEVTFIISAVFLAYLEIQLANDLVGQIRASRKLAPEQILAAYAVLIPTAWLVASLWPLLESPRKRFAIEALPPAGDLLIVLGTLSLPLLAPGIQRIGFGDVHIYDEPPGPEPLMQTAILLSIVASAAVGLLWNRRLWGICAAIFYVPFFLFYTTFFTNGGDIWNPSGEFWHGEGGWWTGIWGSLDYWLSQQLVRRGNQPDYYYFMFLPVYEFLPVVFALGGALYYAFRGRLEQAVLTGATLFLVLALLLLPDDTAVLGAARIHLSFLVLMGSVLLLTMDSFTKFLVFWWLGILFGITVAGEKMPWLTVHIALPSALLAAKVLNDILSPLWEDAKPPPAAKRGRGTRARKKEPAMAAALPRIAPVLYGGILALLAAVIFQTFGPVSGVSVIAWLLAVGVAALVYWVGSTVSWRLAGQVATVALFASFFVFTVRAGVNAAYDEGDRGSYPNELFIYAQGAPDLTAIRNEIDRLAETTGKGGNLKIILDNSVNTWPWPWYLRHYHNVEYNNFETDIAPEPGSVVLVSQANQGKLASSLDLFQEPIPYTHMWWFPERYRGGEGQPGPSSVWDFFKEFFQGHYLSTWRGFFIDRTVPNVSSAPDMLAFFPSDFEPKIIGPTASISQADQTLIGGAGTEPGQFAQPADMAVDAGGNLFVVDTLNQRVQKIAPDGSALAAGEPGDGDGQFANPQLQSAEYAPDGPWGIDVDAEGNVYVADTWNHRIQKFGPNLGFKEAWGVGDLFGPRDLVVDPEGNILVVDTGNSRIVKYSPSGELLGSYGGAGSGDGQFLEPSSITLAPSGDIYVADYWNRRIQRFDSNFTFLSKFEVESWGSHGVTDRAYIAALDDGRVLATDPANGAVLVFDAEGEQVDAFTLKASGSRPVGLVLDGQGNVYISDGFASEVVRVPLSAFATRE